MSLLEVRNLSFAYGSQNVFQDINLRVEPGEVLFLLGPNGCGKTTLLDCVLGLLKPGQGDIFLKGENLCSMRREGVARQMAYVPQIHERTFPYSVMDIVLMGRAAYIGMFSSPSTEDVVAAEEALQMLGIYELRNRRYTELSGGEGQVVMIARALAQKSQLIIMDEPTAHLDYQHELLIMEKIVELVRQTGLAILMATHFPNHAFYFENNNTPTQVALMSQKRFLAVGRPGQVLTEENLKLLYNVNTRVVSCSIDDKKELKQVIPISTVA